MLFIQSMSYVYKKNVLIDKNPKLIYFLFLQKTRVEASKFISSSLKTLDSVFYTFLWQKCCNMWPVNNKTR